MRLFRADYVRRQYFRRVLLPISRLALEPRVVARTMVVGMAWGMSATAGLQLIGVMLTWAVARPFRWHFNAPIAVLVTGISNAVTLPPLYTLYFFTGCSVMTCGFGEFQFRVFLNQMLEAPITTALGAWPFLLAVLVGSIPFTIASCVGAHYFGLYLGRRMQARRNRRALVPRPETPLPLALPPLPPVPMPPPDRQERERVPLMRD